MKKLFISAIVFSAAMLMTSCYNTRLYYGDVTKTEPLVKVNSEWNHHLIGGLVPLKSAEVNVQEYAGDAKDYVIKTNMSFWNYLVGGITMGIYTPTQTSLYVPQQSVEAEK